MYRYDEFDQSFVRQRVGEFSDQVARRLSGDLTEEEFRPLRLMNGLYLQLHAYMLRVAIPYGTLSTNQMRKLAHIARKYDKGFGHFTTRQNIQYNWPKLVDVPDILSELADVEMHAIQTSGNCIRNTTADPYAGVAADELEDPRPYCEIIRQWSSLHPEFSFLPRKFKIAVTGAPTDRAAVRFHDIGLRLWKNAVGETGFEVMVGGGQGRTPVIAKTIRDFLPKEDMLTYLEAILRVYNQLGRRDNIYKARIKILVNETGPEEFARLVEKEWDAIRHGALKLPKEELARIAAYFAPPVYESIGPPLVTTEVAGLVDDFTFRRWLKTNVSDHKQPGYAVVTISLKPIGGIPGDASAAQMETVADLADRFSLGEIRVTHSQNLVLPDVKIADLAVVWHALEAANMGTPNINQATDIIACPGLDYCNLANARSIPIAQRISDRLAEVEQSGAIGDLKINISGCINACGHHHVGHIGILGVDKKGKEAYQITLGGSSSDDASIGQIIGRAMDDSEIVDAVEQVVTTYLDVRSGPDELFIETYRRVGAEPFKESVYAAG